jgi:hypothetical protein
VVPLSIPGTIHERARGTRETRRREQATPALDTPRIYSGRDQARPQRYRNRIEYRDSELLFQTMRHAGAAHVGADHGYGLAALAHDVFDQAGHLGFRHFRE